MRTHNSISLLLIAIGFVFLLNTFEIIPWEVWNNLWAWWPIVVIFAGLDMVAQQSALLRRIIIMIEILILTAIVLSLTNRVSIHYVPTGIPKEV